MFVAAPSALQLLTPQNFSAFSMTHDQPLFSSIKFHLMTEFMEHQSFDGQVVQDSTGLELNFQIWNMLHLPVQTMSNLDKFRLSPWFHSSQNYVNFLRVTWTVDSVSLVRLLGIEAGAI
jgi:hypothetical protein